MLPMESIEDSIDDHEDSIDDHVFEASWQVFVVESSSFLAPGNTCGVHTVFDEACSIFYVASDLEITHLVVGMKDVPLIATGRVEDETKEWRVHEGPVDVPAGTGVTFYVRNASATEAQPLLTYISRAPRVRGST